MLENSIMSYTNYRNVRLKFNKNRHAALLNSNKSHSFIFNNNNWKFKLIILYTAFQSVLQKYVSQTITELHKFYSCINSKINTILNNETIQNNIVLFANIPIIIIVSLFIIIFGYANKVEKSDLIISNLQTHIESLNVHNELTESENIQLEQELEELKSENNSLKADLKTVKEENKILKEEFADINLSAAQISKDSLKQMIMTTAKQYGVDPYLAVAISRHETENWTSSLCLYSNNFGGMQGADGWLKYSTAFKGIDAFCRLLKSYSDNGMSTIGSMAYTYCGPNYDE